jgi:hypothetical protein
MPGFLRMFLGIGYMVLLWLVLPCLFVYWAVNSVFDYTTDTATVYSAKCSEPVSEDGLCHGELRGVYPRQRVRGDISGQNVVLRYIGPFTGVRKLTDCTVMDNANWACREAVMFDGEYRPMSKEPSNEAYIGEMHWWWHRSQRGYVK